MGQITKLLMAAMAFAKAVTIAARERRLFEFYLGIYVAMRDGRKIF
jgi:hypothetical protein